MRKFGLIGSSLTHSFSKKYFEEKFQRETSTDCDYRLYELSSIEELTSFLKSNPELEGLNVTIPYKESVIAFLDFVTQEAKEIGAVNCIRIADGKLYGHNTDVTGFEVSLQRCLVRKPKQIFVLGTGGSSKAVCYVLNKLQLPFLKVSREPKEDCITYNNIGAKVGESNLLINTTPVGMFPAINSAPEIPYELLTHQDFLFDLIYNPEETLFLKRGKERGCKTCNGLLMLEIQAEKSWEIWNKKQ